jgi:3-oxoacyl-[acyl-carrier protein] reductase
VPRISKLSRSISGSRAIITGAASGIGRATAQLFADEGARLALLDINEAALNALAIELRDAGADVLPIQVDLSSRLQVEQSVKHAIEHLAGLDILVNNAGLAIPSAIEDDNYADAWDRSFAIMASAQAWAVRAALPALRQADHPRVINLASTEALGATRFNSAYSAAKHASMGLTRALAVDLGKEGITVNCVCPGPVRTGITQGIPEQQKLQFANRRTALRRYADPEEIAHAVLSLALPASSFITGAALVVDGGLTIRNA